VTAPATPVNQCSPAGGTGGGAVVGGKHFPLDTTKAGILNRNMFRNNTADRGGHPYIAFDILANPGTKVVAFSAGRVKHIGSDRCPGRLVSVTDDAAGVTVSYLHLELTGHVARDTMVQPGDFIGTVGTAVRGCGTPHLHIDAVNAPNRIGCSRLSCSAYNASRFIDIGPELYTTYQTLPDGGITTP
jgi:murein DD-endopeptidase MepM/ murein hydrolase activator NlpD